MAYPDFVCMGFQKCGTTTLYEILKQHPQVALCRDVKEPMYYRVPLMDVFGMGKRYYRRRYFGHLKEDDPRLKGEVNAGLTFSGCERKLRRDFSKDTKMIFMMRNPVDRSYSAYKYFLARGFLPSRHVAYDAAHGHAAGFDHYVHEVLDHPGRRRAVMRKRQRYLVLSQSNYAACIGEYLKDFNIENMHFVIFEEFIQSPHEACMDIYRFLGLPDVPEIQYSARFNEGNQRAVSDLWAKIFMIAKGMNYFFYDLCGLSRLAPGLYKLYAKLFAAIRKRTLRPETDKSRVLPETREYLMEYLKGDIAQLERLTGRDLHAIWGISPSRR